MSKIIEGTLASQIVDAVGEVVDKDINFINPMGMIIASTDSSRIGAFHEIGYEVAKSRKMIAVSGNESYEGTKMGVNYPIVIGQEVFGVIGITGDPKQVMQYGFLASKISEIFIKEARLLGSIESRKTMIGNLMNLCIYEVDAKAEIIHDMMSKLHIKASQKYYCMVLEIPKNSLDYIEGEQRIHQLLSHYNIELYMYQYPNHFVLIVPQPRMRELKSFLAGIKTGESHQLLGGIGEGEPIEQIRSSYQTALIALRYAKHKDVGILDSSEMDIELLYEQLPETARAQYVTKILGSLTREEEQLLETYYKCNMSLKSTADQLYIHKNTVQYRLDKIHEKTGLNPREFKDSVKLYCALYLQTTQ
ncbi:MAG: CdaR family transcriptional regulator [Cellulosilyticaceae bacterium]